MSFLPYAVAIWVIGVALYGIVTSRDLVHLVICLAVLQSSSYLVLLSIGYVHDAKAPVFADIPLGTRAVDPVVQALTLTDVVVGTTVTALLLALSVQAHKRYGTLDPRRLRPQRGRRRD
jgi:multicomponent Na+:H+ antiporter subunit C